MVGGAGVVAGEVVTGVPVVEPPLLDTVEEPVDPVATVTPEAGVLTAAVVVVVVVVVVVPPCGVKGLRPRPASLELAGWVLTEIAGSALPVE